MEMPVVQAGSRPLRVREPIFRNQGGTAENIRPLQYTAGDFLLPQRMKRKGD